MLQAQDDYQTACPEDATCNVVLGIAISMEPQLYGWYTVLAMFAQKASCAFTGNMFQVRIILE